MTVRLEPFLSRLKIKDKRAQVIPLTLNPEQRQYLDMVEDDLNAGRPARYIILKARQMGMSTLTEGLIFGFSFMWPGTKSAIVAHETKASQNLLAMTNLYWKQYAFKSLYTEKYNSKNELSWKETDSSIWVTTAKNPDTGRSNTLQCVHASEVAFWDDAETTFLSLLNTVPVGYEKTFVVLESTANGIGGYFYDTWRAAEAGDVEFKPLFFPWYTFDEYRASRAGIDWGNSLGRLNAEEKALRKLGIDDDQLAWRRWMIRNRTGNSVDKFHQEYPTTADEAFIATGMNIFPLDNLVDCFVPKNGVTGGVIRMADNSIQFKPYSTGPLTVYKYPSSSHNFGQYFVGGDPTHTTRGDYACAQVINRRTWEQVAVWRGKIDPASFGRVLRDLARYYNNAMISTEIEGPGYATIGALLESGYPHIWKKRGADKEPGKVNDNYGWSTSDKTKQWAIGVTLKAVIDKDLTIHHMQTFMEMRDYVTLPDGTMGPASRGDNDDTVMALAIAIICNATEAPLPVYDEDIAYLDSGDNPYAHDGLSDAGMTYEGYGVA